MRKEFNNKEYVGVNQCRKSRCKCCLEIQEGQYFQSTKTKLQYKIKRNYLFKSEGVVYLATCKSCKQQYVGETKRQLKDRLTNRRADIKSSISGKNENYKVSIDDDNVPKKFNTDGVVADCIEYPSHEFVTTIISADIKG
ncbi:hypothetical protein GJ496_001086 [Pomphorhynchus laevis]|nr:hypothetical protein GJ496_001086 [Pomphorhynchus laevis]